MSCPMYAVCSAGSPLPSAFTANTLYSWRPLVGTFASVHDDCAPGAASVTEPAKELSRNMSTRVIVVLPFLS